MPDRYNRADDGIGETGGSAGSGWRLCRRPCPVLPLRALFEDTVADALSTQAMAKVADLVAGLDRDSRPREITTAFVAVPGWLEREG